MQYISVKGKIEQFCRKKMVYFSLMVIAINPLSEGGEEGNQSQSLSPMAYDQSQLATTPVVTAAHHTTMIDQKILDYYKLGKLYLLQGQLGNSYKAFLMGENLEDVGAINHGNLLGSQSAIMAPSIPHEGAIMGEDSLSEYLKNLVSLYLKRVEMLSKNPAYLDEARKEVDKIFIIDPRNKRAQELAREIKEKQESLHKGTESPAPAKITEHEASISQSITQRDTKGQGSQLMQTEKSAPMSYVQRNVPPRISEKDQALLSAEQQIHASILNKSDMDENELTLMRFYDQGKQSLKQKNYYRAIGEFKKVLALDSNHLYADYARKFIAAAKGKIEEKEAHDLKLVQKEKIVEEVPAQLASPHGGGAHEFNAAVTQPSIQFTQQPSPLDQMKMKREEVLRSQISNVLVSIRKFIREGRYLAAQENLNALLAIAPHNKEAHALHMRVQQLVSQKREQEREEIIDEIVGIKDEEEARDAYFAKQKRRQDVRQDVKEKYKMAQDNIRALLAIDPENDEARALELHLKEVLSEKKERDRIESNILRIQAEEELRREYFARVKRRAQARKKIEEKYKAWEKINQDTMRREVRNKIADKLSDARSALSQNDYFRTNKELEILSIISPDNVEAKEIREKLRTNIQQLTALLGGDTKPQKESTQTNVVSQEKDHAHSLKTPAVQIKKEVKKEKAMKETTPRDIHADGKGVFKNISNFRPITVFNPQVPSHVQKTEDIQPEVPITPQKEKAPVKVYEPTFKVYKKQPEKKDIVPQSGSNKQQAVALLKTEEVTTSAVTHTEKRISEDYVLSLRKDVFSDASNNKQKLMKYLVRGKRHFRQGNYPLALVSFNKVKSLDKEQLFLDEVEELLSATRKHLEKNNSKSG